MYGRIFSWLLGFFVGIASVSLVNISLAADAPVRPPLVHRISGPIDSTSLAGFMRQVKPALANGSFMLLLDSPGGQMGAARLISELMDYLANHQVKTITHIESGARCQSACVMIYAAGRQRTAGPLASVGLHGVRDGQTGRLDQPAGDRLVGFLSSRGVASSWLAELTANGVFSRNAVTSFSSSELIEPGLVHAIFSRS